MPKSFFQRKELEGVQAWTSRRMLAVKGRPHGAGVECRLLFQLGLQDSAITISISGAGSSKPLAIKLGCGRDHAPIASEDLPFTKLHLKPSQEAIS
jgi:hypothetical protein